MYKRQGYEHIWLSYITFEDGNYYGKIDNSPEYTTKFKIGDKLKIDTQTISDWNYSKGDTIYGGYTIKAIYDNLTEDKKKTFNDDYLGG